VNYDEYSNSSFKCDMWRNLYSRRDDVDDLVRWKMNWGGMEHTKI
jgi:hypothetical protein